MKLPPSTRRWIPWLVAALVTTGSFALRWPTFGFEVWNVDEAIHAAVARTLNDGGVLYRDAIDQRTPLTYYAVAALFRIGGANNVWAMHALAAALVAGTAFGLFLLARAWRGPLAGLWAALFFTVFATALFYPGDAYALNTEWFVALFTTWAAWLFWRGAPGWAGGLLGLAFLSKQPALLDLGAPLVVVAYVALGERAAWARLARRLGAVLAGFAVPVLLTVAYFAARGALADFHFYAWQYNLQFYAPEIGIAGRAASTLKPFHLLAAQYPLALAALAATAGLGIFCLFRPRADTAARTENAQWLYLLTWAVTSLAGAASGGRGFDHYYIQFLPACCLLAALGLGGLAPWAAGHRARRFLVPALVLLSALFVLELGQGIRRQHGRTLPMDPSWRAGEFIRTHTGPEERIFVWGYHPDLYLFAGRKPASRFVYASFLSGLIPWTNTAPDKDTTYAIVPGARETLLRELAAVRPAFVVDCSFGPNRWWNKYPLATFPALEAFLAENYIVVEPDQFTGQGFRLHLIKDAYRRDPPVLAGGAAAARLGVPELFVTPLLTEPPALQVAITARSATGRLQRLELLHNGTVLAGASFAPSPGLLLSWPVPFARLGAGEHRLSVRATAANGETATSAEQVFAPDPGLLPAGRLAEFSLPLMAGSLVPTSVLAPFGATASQDDGRLVFQLHAPATVRYPLAGTATHLHGRFGLSPGAYAATNPARTDGAEFQVVFVSAAGDRQVLFRRLLQPGREPADGGPQPFSVDLPAGARGRLELLINNGPAGNPASDWTYWSDLQLETSR
ncbi:MAG: hypothetical protein PSV13_14860 [Lacunisphaera sp.]|nr:hypothetical protein [Lacunisphaera sp.]